MAQHAIGIAWNRAQAIVHQTLKFKRFTLPVSYASTRLTNELYILHPVSQALVPDRDRVGSAPRNGGGT